MKLNLHSQTFVGKREYKPRIESDDDKPENCLMRPFLLMLSKKTPVMLAPDMLSSCHASIAPVLKIRLFGLPIRGIMKLLLN